MDEEKSIELTLINHLIKEKSVSKQKLAERCQITPEYLSRVINGKVKGSDKLIERLITHLERLNTNIV